QRMDPMAHPHERRMPIDQNPTATRRFISAHEQPPAAPTYIGGATPFSPTAMLLVMRPPAGVGDATRKTLTPACTRLCAPGVICTIGTFGGTTIWRAPGE